MKLIFLILTVAANSVSAQQALPSPFTKTSSRSSKELPDMPSARTNCADVVPYLRSTQALGPCDKEALLRKMPPWLRRPAVRPVSERPFPQAARNRHHREVGGRRRARRRPGTRRLQSGGAEGWFIKPDIIVDGPTTDVPARPENNVVEWITVVMPSGFTKDTWVTSVQIKPEFPEITHHMCISYVPHNPNGQVQRGVLDGISRDEERLALPDKGPTFLGPGTDRASSGRRPTPSPARGCASRLVGRTTVTAGQLRGGLSADNAAELIPAGSDITFNLHYTPNGKS